MPTTLLNCFESGLPDMKTDPEAQAKAEKTKAKASGQTTMDAPPPRFFIAQGVERWTIPADTFLKSDVAKKCKELVEEYIPATEKNKVQNEADVVRLSGLYLIHPVVMAIDAVFEEDIFTSSEFPQKSSRVDLTFQNPLATNIKSKKHKIVMLLEYKHRGFVKIAEFEPATWNGKATVEQIRKILAEMDRDGEDYKLQKDQNAYWFTKQAAGYYNTYKCEYAVIHDYDTLILIHFDNMPDSARITIVQRKDFRKALLGFLIEACLAKGLKYSA